MRCCGLLLLLGILLGGAGLAAWPALRGRGAGGGSIGSLDDGVALRPCSGEVAIVITVHGALEYLAECLQSLERNTEDVHVFLSDDSANATETAQLARILRGFTLPHTHIVMGDTAKGYTLTINAGLRRAHQMGFKIMICLNSDTILTTDVSAE